jgi:hypothetical protein
MNYSNLEQKPDKNKTIQELLYETCDNKDPISQTDIWIMENNNKTIVYPVENYDKIKFYHESDTILRCFEIESLRFLKTYNIIKHPISLKIIPSFMFDNIEIINENEISINIVASNVFRIFTDMFIFIDHELFLSLSKDKLITFYTEFKSFWNNNLSITIRNEISNTILNNSNIENYDLIDIQRYLLNQIKILLEYDGEHKSMITHIIIGALSIVIPEVRTEYYIFDFDL